MSGCIVPQMRIWLASCEAVVQISSSYSYYRPCARCPIFSLVFATIQPIPPLGVLQFGA